MLQMAAVVAGLAAAAAHDGGIPALRRAPEHELDAPPARPGKHIDWYFGGHGPAWLEFGLRTHADLVDGLLPCSNNFAPIDCATGRLNVSANWNLSDFGAFLRAGKEVNVQLAGTAACCKSPTDWIVNTILENKEGLAQDVLELALLYNLSGFTQDWEFGAKSGDWWWAGWNRTMAHVAAVLRPQGIGLGLSVNSVCGSESLAVASDPTCAPAYRDTPWAAMLADMGTYALINPGPTEDGRRNGWPWRAGDVQPNMTATRDMRGCAGSVGPDQDPAVMQWCGFESRVLNLLESPRATIRRDRWPQLAPALWVGGCNPNGSTPTLQGWTRPTLRSFLTFLDAEQVPRLAIWCMGPAWDARPGPWRGHALPRHRE